MKLNDRALLAQLSISQWTGRKFDKKATKEVANSHGISEFVGRYNKSLLPAQDLLKQVHTKSGSIRTAFYENTLPWGLEGTYILPTSNYLAYKQQFAKQKSEWETLVNQFIAEYPYLRQSAKQHLGSLYNDADYPDTGDMQRRFKLDVAFFPVPANDFRCQIASDELSRIQQDVEKRVQAAAQTAMKDVWRRLYERVEHISNKLKDPKAIFRDSMIENARELCEMLPRLNFSDDPDLERLRQQVEQKIINHHPNQLRSDTKLRQQTADEATQILDAMGVFMGAN